MSDTLDNGQFSKDEDRLAQQAALQNRLPIMIGRSTPRHKSDMPDAYDGNFVPASLAELAGLTAVDAQHSVYVITSQQGWKEGVSGLGKSINFNTKLATFDISVVHHNYVGRRIKIGAQGLRADFRLAVASEDSPLRSKDATDARERARGVADMLGDAYICQLSASSAALPRQPHFRLSNSTLTLETLRYEIIRRGLVPF